MSDERITRNRAPVSCGVISWHVPDSSHPLSTNKVRPLAFSDERFNWLLIGLTSVDAKYEFSTSKGLNVAPGVIQ